MDKLLRILCSVSIFIAIVFNASYVCAKENVLSSVTVSSGENGSYEIILGTSKPAKYTIKQISNDKIILNLKNTTTSNMVDTVYKNAENLEHVIIKPSAGETTIEIMGENSANSNITLTGGVAKTNSFLWQIFLLLGIVGVGFMAKKRNRREYSTKISIADEENKILKVEFERKGGLIARGTSTKQHHNVRKVAFENGNTIRELNLR